MEVINKYFESLVFTKLEEKRSEEGQAFFLYGAKVHGRFEDGTSRYVFLLVPSHLSIKSKAKIHELPWENLQTRRLKVDYKLITQSWRPERGIEDVLLYVQRREKRYSVYAGSPSFPFEILLIHDPKKKTVYQFFNKMALSSVLDTFSSSIKYTGQIPSMNFTQQNQGFTPYPSTNPELDIDDSFDIIE